jgi:hypothetical protein
MVLRGRIRLLGRVRPKVRVEGTLDSNDHATGCRHTLDMLLRDEYSEKVTQKTDVVAAGAGAEEDRPTLLLRLKRKNPPPPFCYSGRGPIRSNATGKCLRYRRKQGVVEWYAVCMYGYDTRHLASTDLPFC